LLKATLYVQFAGSVKVARPWELVTPCSEDGRHRVNAGGVTTTLTPDIGLPWLSTALTDIVTFGGQTAEIVEEIIVVMAVVEVEAATVVVVVAVNVPPKGANLNIVERGVL
jgi:hypothetical protein